MSRVIKCLLTCFVALIFFSGKSPSFSDFRAGFITGYNDLSLPELAYDYHEYFQSIPSEEALKQQQHFFIKEQSLLKDYDRSSLKSKELIDYDHISYEVDFNLQRISLEQQWIGEGRKIPSGGLHELSNYKDWYAFFVKKYTSTEITPEAVFTMGQSEVSRVKSEITRIRLQLGFTDSTAFYNHLKSAEFFLTDKDKIVARFLAIDKTVRNNLKNFVGKVDLPEIFPMEWPDAGPNTPPGIYLNHEFNAYGKDVFQYNFYGGKYNARAMEWLYMHEAIPGHHLQFSWREKYLAGDSLQPLFFYSGTAEGWGCYVEYFGKELGLYTDPYEELGKWEWDLVRSARLVLDAGIHYYGWTREEALDYWKKNITGQDDIAEREVTRVTNWTAQALSYKVGADFIFKLKEKCKNVSAGGYDERKFHRAFLSFGLVPLQVIDKDFPKIYSETGS